MIVSFAKISVIVIYLLFIQRSKPMCDLLEPMTLQCRATAADCPLYGIKLNNAEKHSKGKNRYISSDTDL